MGVRRSKVVTIIEHGLVVSCQAYYDHSLRDPSILAALARCPGRGVQRLFGPVTRRRGTDQPGSLSVIEIYKILLSGRLFFARDETLTARRTGLPVTLPATVLAGL